MCIDGCMDMYGHVFQFSWACTWEWGHWARWWPPGGFYLFSLEDGSPTSSSPRPASCLCHLFCFSQTEIAVLKGQTGLCLSCPGDSGIFCGLDQAVGAVLPWARCVLGADLDPACPGPSSGPDVAWASWVPEGPLAMLCVCW